MISLNIEVSDATELQKQIMGLAGSTFLSQYPDESLLSELRQRMATKGLVVKVVPFDEEETTGVALTRQDIVTLVDEVGTAETAPKGRPGRKPKVAAAEPAATTTTVQAEPEAPKLADPASDTAKAMTETTTQAVVYTDADVKVALNLFAAANGQMKAREKIKTVGGSDRLMDVKPEKYGELIAALAVEKVAEKAAA